MELNDYLNIVNCKFDDDLRYGQRAFNLLHQYRPDLAVKVVGTDIDPFYASRYDDRVSNFFAFVMDNWEN